MEYHTRTTTAGQVIRQVDDLSPNRYTHEQKLRWLGALEGRIYTEVLLTRPEELEEVGERWQDALIVSWPYSELYTHWLMAQIHQANGELELYQNRMEQFNETFGAFERWYVRHCDPAHRDIREEVGI